MSKKKSGLAGTSSTSLMDRYAALPPDAVKTKFIRSGVDTAGALTGVVVGGAMGKYAPLYGVGLIALGNFMGDKTGVTKTVGAAMLAYGVAKWFENNDTSKSAADTTVKTRLTKVKDELMGSFFLDKIFKPKTEGVVVDKPVGELSGEFGSLEALDLSALDMFDDFNEQEAAEFESLRGYSVSSDELEAEPVGSDLASPAEDISYTIIEDDDLSGL